MPDVDQPPPLKNVAEPIRGRHGRRLVASLAFLVALLCLQLVTLEQSISTEFREELSCVLDWSIFNLS